MNYSNEELLIALKSSLRLQSHYAELLNMYDGGTRLQFSSIESWLNRIRDLGTMIENGIKSYDKEKSNVKQSPNG